MDFQIYVKEVDVCRPPDWGQNCACVGIGVKLLDFPAVLIGVFSRSLDGHGERFQFSCNKGKSCRFRMDRDSLCELLRREKYTIEVILTDASCDPAKLIARGYFNDPALLDQFRERSRFNSKAPVVEKKYLVLTTNRCGKGNGYVILKLKLFVQQEASGFQEEHTSSINGKAIHMVSKAHTSSPSVTSVGVVAPCVRKWCCPGHWVPPPLHFRSPGLPVAAQSGDDETAVDTIGSTYTKPEYDSISAQHWAVLMDDGCNSWPLKFSARSSLPSQSLASVHVQTEPLSKAFLHEFPVLSALCSEVEVLKRTVDSSSMVITETANQAVQTEPQYVWVDSIVPTPVKEETKSKTKRFAHRQFTRSCCSQAVASPQHPVAQSRLPPKRREKQQKQATSILCRQRRGKIAARAKSTGPTASAVKSTPKGQKSPHPLEKRMVPPPPPPSCVQQEGEEPRKDLSAQRSDESSQTLRHGSSEGSDDRNSSGPSNSDFVLCAKSAATGVTVIPPTRSSSSCSLHSAHSGDQSSSQIPEFKMSTDSLESTRLGGGLLQPHHALHGKIYLANSSQSIDALGEISSPGSMTNVLRCDLENEEAAHNPSDGSASHSSSNSSGSTDQNVSYPDDFESDEMSS